MNCKGFTLVEVFLVATLLGALLMTILSSYVVGAKLWKAAEDPKLLRDRAYHLAVMKMNRDMRGHIRDFEAIPFEGGQERLSLPGMAGLDIVKVEYIFEKNQKAILKKTVIYSDSLKDEMNEKTIKLLAADEAGFSYLFPKTDGIEDMGGWVTEFSAESGAAPAAVRLDTVKDGEKSSAYVFIPD